MADEESGKCHKHLSPEAPPSFFQNGDAVFQAHHVGWIVCGVFTIIATVASFWLINKHLQWYTNKKEQRFIVRLLFLVPIYAIVSFASFLFWNNSTPLILVRDAYEAIVLTAFFYLLLNYLSPDPEEQRWIFLKFGISQENDAARRLRGEKPQKWMWPMGFVKSKPKDGLYFLQLMKWGVLQYCVIRPLTTLIAVIMDYMGYYCEASWAPKWGHLWIVLIISISVTIAMYCLIQIYMPVTKQLEPHRPLLKLFAVKAVVFLTFWQATFLGLLSLFGVVKNGKYMTAEDINIGIGALLQTFEMMIFAFLHIKAFTYKPYRPFYNPESKEPPPAKTPRLRSLGNVLDFRETFREIWVGCIYLWDKMRGKEPSPDFGVRRAAHYEGAFGRPRPGNFARPSAAKQGKKEKSTKSPEVPPIMVEREVEVDVGGERQWLGNGDDYGYGLGYFRRERSEAFSVQIEKELQKRGFSNDSIQASQSNSSNIPERNQAAPATRKQRQGSSWWRALYDRFSSSGHDDDNHDNLTPSSPRRLQSRSRPQQHGEAQHGLLRDDEHDLSDPPPASAFRSSAPIIPELRYSPVLGKEYYSGGGGDNDGLGPLSLYRERRRSSRPKRQRGDSSSALLLPPSPPPVQHANWRSDREGFDDDASAMDIRQGGGNSQELLAIPTGHNNRSDSLLHRLFPPSEAGSLNDQTRETDSAYSLSVDDHHVRHQLGGHMPTTTLSSNRAERVRQDPASKPLPVLTGDRRLQVHEQMVHPSRSATAMLAPWTADVVGLRSQSTLDEPPTPPAKDSRYSKSYGSPVSRPQQEQRSGRSHIRESAHYHPQDALDLGPSPSLPEGARYGGYDDQGMPGLPASPSSATSFSSRPERGYPPSFSAPEPVSPPASHVRETRNRKVPERMPDVIPATSARSGPSRKSLRPPPPDSSSHPSTSRGHHDVVAPTQAAPPATPPRKERKPQRRQLHTPPASRPRSADSDNDSDASGNTFYTAASYPPDSAQIPPVPRR